MSYCPFQPPTVEKQYNINRDIGMLEQGDDYKWQKCGKTCALYSEKLQECVFGTIAIRLGNIAEQLDNIERGINPPDPDYYGGY